MNNIHFSRPLHTVMNINEIRSQLLKLLHNKNITESSIVVFYSHEFKRYKLIAKNRYKNVDISSLGLDRYLKTTS